MNETLRRNGGGDGDREVYRDGEWIAEAHRPWRDASKAKEKGRSDIKWAKEGWRSGPVETGIECPGVREPTSRSDHPMRALVLNV